VLCSLKVPVSAKVRQKNPSYAACSRAPSGRLSRDWFLPCRRRWKAGMWPWKQRLLHRLEAVMLRQRDHDTRHQRRVPPSHVSWLQPKLSFCVIGREMLSSAEQATAYGPPGRDGVSMFDHRVACRRTAVCRARGPRLPGVHRAARLGMACSAPEWPRAPCRWRTVRLSSLGAGRMVPAVERR